MTDKKGKPQKRGINYEKSKAKAHKARHIGGPGKPDAIKKGVKIEIKDWRKPVPKSEIITAVRKGVRKFISKSGFTKPAIDYAKKRRIKLYKGRRLI